MTLKSWATSIPASAAYQRNSYNSVIVKLDGPKGFDALRAALLHDPTLSVQVFKESEYYARQSQTFASFLGLIAQGDQYHHGHRGGFRRLEYHVLGGKHPRG